MSSVHNQSTTKLVSHLVQEDPDLREVVEEFVTGLEERLHELQEAYTKLDWELLATLAHRLKGAGGSYGYPDISQLCAQMEAGFRAHEADAFQDWYTQLDSLFAAARAGLED